MLIAKVVIPKVDRAIDLHEQIEEFLKQDVGTSYSINECFKDNGSNLWGLDKVKFKFSYESLLDHRKLEEEVAKSRLLYEALHTF